MHAITEPLALLWCRGQCSAGATLLRRVGGWNRDDLHAGPFRLAMQDVEESAPADIVCGLGQPAARDTVDVEVFVRDHAVLADELSRDVVVEVAPLAGD